MEHTCLDYKELCFTIIHQDLLGYAIHLHPHPWPSQAYSSLPLSTTHVVETLFLLCHTPEVKGSGAYLWHPNWEITKCTELLSGGQQVGMWDWTWPVQLAELQLLQLWFISILQSTIYAFSPYATHLCFPSLQWIPLLFLLFTKPWWWVQLSLISQLYKKQNQNSPPT